MARTLKHSKLNPASNPDYVTDGDGSSDASGGAAARAHAIVTANLAGDGVPAYVDSLGNAIADATPETFDARAAAKAALARAQ